MKALLFSFIVAPLLVFSAGIEDAKTYYSNSEMQLSVALQTIDLVSWDESASILDIGCGDGKITALLAQKTPRGSVLGVDISPSMIEFASIQYPEEEFPNLSFKTEDAANLSFENRFDTVVSFSALHWVLNQEKALEGIYQALVPGGTICMHIYGKGCMNVTDIAHEAVQSEKWSSYFPDYTQSRVFFSLEEYQKLVENAGFEEVQTKGFWNETPFSSRSAFIAFVKPLFNFARHLDPILYREFVEDVADRVIAKAGISDSGEILYRTFNIQVLGRKAELSKH